MLVVLRHRWLSQIDRLQLADKCEDIISTKAKLLLANLTDGFFVFQ